MIIKNPDARYDRDRLIIALINEIVSSIRNAQQYRTSSLLFVNFFYKLRTVHLVHHRSLIKSLQDPFLLVSNKTSENIAKFVGHMNSSAPLNSRNNRL